MATTHTANATSPLLNQAFLNCMEKALQHLQQKSGLACSIHAVLPGKGIVEISVASYLPQLPIHYPNGSPQAHQHPQAVFAPDKTVLSKLRHSAMLGSHVAMLWQKQPHLLHPSNSTELHQNLNKHGFSCTPQHVANIIENMLKRYNTHARMKGRPLAPLFPQPSMPKSTQAPKTKTQPTLLSDVTQVLKTQPRLVELQERDRLTKEVNLLRQAKSLPPATCRQVRAAVASERHRLNRLKLQGKDAPNWSLFQKK